MNVVFIIGNLTTDPEMTQSTDGENRCVFCVAVNRDYLNKETGKRDADYIRVVSWGRLGEVCMQHLKKGNRVAVKGRIKGRSIPKEDGTRFYTTEVKADTVEFLSPKDEEPEKPKETQYPKIDADDPSLPF